MRAGAAALAADERRLRSRAAATGYHTAKLSCSATAPARLAAATIVCQHPSATMSHRLASRGPQRCTQWLRQQYNGSCQLHVLRRTQSLAEPAKHESNQHRPLSTSAHRSSNQVWRVDNPYSGDIVAEIAPLSDTDARTRIDNAHRAYQQWRHTSLDERIQLLQRFIQQLESHTQDIATEISQQMGKPLKQALGEVSGVVQRVNALIDLAPEALADEEITGSHRNQSGVVKKIVKDPLGVILVLSPWNYPLLTAINSVAPAILCGNSVLIKHSDRTPLCANRFEQLFAAAGAPQHLVQSLHIKHSQIENVVKHPAIAFVQMTGSVGGGRAVYSTVARNRFIDVGLELGGKDAAYVADDADLQYAIENVVDGGLYNAGQSCCAVERVYVHQSIYQKFLDGAAAVMQQYKLGDPSQDSTSLGPIAQPQHISNVLDQHIADAKSKGAKFVTGGQKTTDSTGKGRFYQPTLVADCDNSMLVMSEETFGPVLAVQSVKSDEEAIERMNDSAYGLTGSIWSSDPQRGEALCRQVDAGTAYLNRSDYLDPYLPWSGRHDSGKGGSFGLSRYGFLPFLRTKGLNMRPKTK